MYNSFNTISQKKKKRYRKSLGFVLRCLKILKLKEYNNLQKY